MAWDALLLSGVGLYATYKTGIWAYQRKSLKFLGFMLAAAFFLLTQFSFLLESILTTYDLTIYSGIINEWGQVIMISFLLSGLAVLVRESKPDFAQFPLIYTGLPLLIIFSYLLVKDTMALKEWLMSIYQGGALLVALLIYSVYTYRFEGYQLLLGATTLFTVTYLLYWLIPGIGESFAWLWQLMLAGSIILTVLGFQKVLDLRSGQKKSHTFGSY